MLPRSTLNSIEKESIKITKGQKDKKIDID